MNLTTAEWLQAWGTIAGAIFAAGAAIAAFLVLLHEIKVRRKDEADLLATTARSIILTTGQPRGKWPSPESDGLITSIDLNVTNFSRSPIVDLKVSAERIDKYLNLRECSTDALGPGEKITLNWGFEPSLGWPNSLEPVSLWRTKMVFTDENGIRWERVDRGQPIRIFSAHVFSVDMRNRFTRRLEG